MNNLIDKDAIKSNALTGIISISFFGFAPGKESDVLREIKSRLKDEDIAVLKGFGHYDMITIHRNTGQQRLLFGGPIPFINSFYNLDCVCRDEKRTIVKTFQNKLLFNIFIIALSRAARANENLAKEKIPSLVKKCGYYLNSVTWNEHVLLFYADTMEELIKINKNILNNLRVYAIDMHSVIGVNRVKLLKLEDEFKKGNIKSWKEKKAEDLSLEWQVHLKHGIYLKEYANRVINLSREKSDFQINEKRIMSSVDNYYLTFEITGKNWGGIIAGIRDLRKDPNNILISTSLNIRHKLI